MKNRALNTEKVKSRGRPKSPAESVRSERVVGLLSPTELLALKEYSARTGLSISEVIRVRVAATIANNPRQDS